MIMAVQNIHFRGLPNPKLTLIIALVACTNMVYSSYLLKPDNYKRLLKNSSLFGERRVNHGKVAEDKQFMYLMFLASKLGQNEYSGCGGSLIKPDTVLSAAHCVEDTTSPDTVIAISQKVNMYEYLSARTQVNWFLNINGSYFGVQERRAKEIFIHPEYTSKTFYHDLSIIILQKNFSEEYAIPIQMDLTPPKEIKNCTIMGYGKQVNSSKNILHYVENKPASPVSIGCLYIRRGPFICLKYEKSGSGICHGDSGSPIVCNNKVWGVASHLRALLILPGCGLNTEQYYNDLYTDREWILNPYHGKGPVFTPVFFLNILAFCTVYQYFIL